MPAAQIVVTKDALVFADKGKIGTAVFRIVEDINESPVVQFDANFEAIPPSFGD